MVPPDHFLVIRQLIYETSLIDRVEIVAGVAEDLPLMWNAVGWHDDILIDAGAGDSATQAVARLARQVVNGTACPFCQRRTMLLDGLTERSSPPDLAAYENDDLHKVLCALFYDDTGWRHACQGWWDEEVNGGE